ncbi:ABC transporter ATP-binding protein [Nocardia sp. CDC159]|uniref:ABC transporter ATP-binding protein n=1 Tax=Nocardia pulmonis TaxID=2951408 RepID=A0A9X2EDV4_9NOCA|nr:MULTISPECIES: ABC transporter ATP-binding protein [Nocardia]MCM6779084.1 ABC transporter ATP-binding protein [Nocardia pulmonis]MCM6791974.1 ABC transporter ATP-binding protein [Nocardia sp. CDC159]
MSIVEVQGLRKSYGAVIAVEDISFAVAEGEIFGILGPNGAGKTTAVECVEGLRVPDAGRIRVAGFDPLREHDEVTRILGVQLQQSELQAKLTVREALHMYSAFYEKPADWRPLVERLGIEQQLGQQFGKLSGGQKQRLFIALSLVGNPKVVVFDELTAALDPRARRETWQLVRDINNSGVTIMLVTHFMEEAQDLCDRVAVFDRGRIVALDTPDGLIRSSDSSVVISFRSSKPLSAAELERLPGAVSVVHEKPKLTIKGTDETVDAVMALLAREHITAHELRVVDATLNDAFLLLTASPESRADYSDTVRRDF